MKNKRNYIFSSTYNSHPHFPSIKGLGGDFSFYKSFFFLCVQPDNAWSFYVDDNGISSSVWKYLLQIIKQKNEDTASNCGHQVVGLPPSKDYRITCIYSKIIIKKQNKQTTTTNKQTNKQKTQSIILVERLYPAFFQ